MKIPERYLVLEPLGHPTPGEWPRTWLTMDRATLEETVFHAAPQGAEPSHLFRRNLARARELASPYVPPILTSSRRDEVPYVASAWIPGVSLYRLTRSQALGTDLALTLTWELTSALAALHAAGLPHGDIHPGNFRITPRAEPVLVGFMPAPFGLPCGSRSLDASVRRYGPPEFHESGLVSAAGDVYSLGLVLFELFTGRALLARGDRRRALRHQEKLQKHLADGGRLAEEIPERLDPVLRSMLHLDRKKRPRSAVAVLAALERSQLAGFRGRPLERILRRPLARALASTQRALEKSLGDRLAHGEYLATATTCRQMGELGQVRDRRTLEVLESTIRDLLWLSFSPPPAEEHREAEETRRRVWVLELYRATGAAGLEDLHIHCQRRLEQLIEDPATIQRLLHDYRLEAPPTRWRGELRRILEGHPGDLEAALELALEAPAESGPVGGGPAEVASAFLQGQNLPAAALFHEVRELADRGRDRDLAKRLARLAVAAAEATGTQAPPAPEPEAPAPGAPAGEVARPAPAREPEARRPPDGPEPPSEPTPPPTPTETPEADEADEAPLGGRSLESILSDAMVMTPPRWEQEQAALESSGAHEAWEPGPTSVPPMIRHLDPTSSTIFEDAAVLFSEAQVLVVDGKLEEAAELFQEILELGDLERERFHTPVCAEVRKLLWRALAQDADLERRLEGLERLLRLTEALELEDLTFVAERLVIGLIPAPHRSLWIEHLLEARRSSIPLLQAKLEDARSTGDTSGQYHAMVSLGWQLLEMGEITPASRLFARAKALGVDSPLADQGLARVLAAGTDLARASAAYRVQEQQLVLSGDIEQGLALLEDFLTSFAGFLPAMERYAQLCLQAGDALEAARMNLILARRALVRGEPGRARERFREVLRIAPDRDESLLYLASLEPPAELFDGDLHELKLHLLEREGLFETAIHLARKRLRGDYRDLSIHARLAQLCRHAGQDPSPHLVAQGVVALAQEDTAAARQLFEEALAETPDPSGTVDSLMGLPGIDRVYSRLELLGRRR